MTPCHLFDILFISQNAIFVKYFFINLLFIIDNISSGWHTHMHTYQLGNSLSTCTHYE